MYENLLNVRILVIFARKNYHNARIFMIFARKINKIPEFYILFARKMPKLYMIIAQKYFSRIWGCGARAP